MRSTIVWGANTGVGKTLVSAGLMRAAAARAASLYLKPVQTGAPDDSDGRHVALLAGGLRHELGLHAAATGLDASRGDGCAVSRAMTLYAWRQPVSPHVAVATEGRAVSDEEVVAATHESLTAFAAEGGEIGLVETAGGVASPAPSGTLQCDLLRPLSASLPSLLVGDGNLGGISQTICAAESLTARGHDVGLVVLLSASLDEGDHRGAGLRLGNAETLRAHFGEQLPVIELPAPPPPAVATQATAHAEARMAEGHDLGGWLDETRSAFDHMLDVMGRVHDARALRRARRSAGE